MTDRADLALDRTVSDKQAIADVIYRYCRGVDRADPDLIALAYDPDAVDEHGDHTFTGTDVGPGIVELTASSRTGP